MRKRQNFLRFLMVLSVCGFLLSFIPLPSALAVRDPADYTKVLLNNWSPAFTPNAGGYSEGWIASNGVPVPSGRMLRLDWVVGGNPSASTVRWYIRNTSGSCSTSDSNILFLPEGNHTEGWLASEYLVQPGTVYACIYYKINQATNRATSVLISLYDDFSVDSEIHDTWFRHTAPYDNKTNSATVPSSYHQMQFTATSSFIITGTVRYLYSLGVNAPSSFPTTVNLCSDNWKVKVTKPDSSNVIISCISGLSSRTFTSLGTYTFQFWQWASAPSIAEWVGSPSGLLPTVTPTLTPTSLTPTATATPAACAQGSIYALPVSAGERIAVYVKGTDMLFGDFGAVNVRIGTLYSGSVPDWSAYPGGLRMDAFINAAQTFRVDAWHNGMESASDPAVLRVCPTFGIGTPTPTRTPTITPMGTAPTPTATKTPLPTPSGTPSPSPTLPTNTPTVTGTPIPTPTAIAECATGPVDGLDCVIADNQRTQIALQETQIAQQATYQAVETPLSPSASSVPNMATVGALLCEREPCSSISQTYEGIGGILGTLGQYSNAPDCDLSVYLPPSGGFTFDGAAVSQGFCAFIDMSYRIRLITRWVSIVVFAIVLYQYYINLARRMGDV